MTSWLRSKLSDAATDSPTEAFSTPIDSAHFTCNRAMSERVIACTTPSPRVFSAHSSGNYYGETNSQRRARHDASSVNTSNSSSTQSGGIQPTDISAQSSLNFVTGISVTHVPGTKCYPCGRMYRDGSFCQMMITINVCCHANMKIVPIRTKWRSSPR